MSHGPTAPHLLGPSPPVAHVLTAMCGVTAVILVVLFRRHHELRKNVPLNAKPSGIATVAAVLSKTEFPPEAKLDPNDTIEVIEDKLRTLRFKLNQGGVQIVTPSEEP